MGNNVRLGFSKWTVPVPRAFWQRQLYAVARYFTKRLEFLTEEHRKIHRFMVCQLTESGVPFGESLVAERLNMGSRRVKETLNDFEKHTGLPIRNKKGRIMRAYPVTLEKTPHRMAISIGNELHADEAFGALAMPFIQKRLRGVSVSGHITTECAYCQQPLHLLVDDNLTVKLIEESPRPVLFAPLPPEKSELKEIASLFLKESVFYCSMEHARRYRKRAGGMRGIYIPLECTAEINRTFQEAIFGSGEEPPG